MESRREPRTLLEAVKFFSDKDFALQFMARIRWEDGKPACPRCGSLENGFLRTRSLWKCRACGKQFSVKVGTLFEDSPIGLDKWLPAMWMLANCKNGISSYELGRALGVTQKTAWFMLHRLRMALHGDESDKFSGHVEADETYIGAKARNMHASKRRRLEAEQRGKWMGKVAVMGLLERNAPEGGARRVRTRVIASARRSVLQKHIREHVVTDGTVTVYTDALPSYNNMSAMDRSPRHLYIHKVIDHAEAYAIGNTHTNGMENFWSLLKRMLKGTYVSVEPFHLFRYLDEQCYRFNNRKASDLARFTEGLKGLLGKRLTYSALTGGELPQTC